MQCVQLAAGWRFETADGGRCPLTKAPRSGARASILMRLLRALLWFPPRFGVDGRLAGDGDDHHHAHGPPQRRENSWMHLETLRRPHA